MSLLLRKRNSRLRVGPAYSHCDIVYEQEPMVNVEFFLYDTLRGMRAGIRAFERRISAKYPHRSFNNDAPLALCIYTIDRQKGDAPWGRAILFFNRQHLGGGVVSHEIMHVMTIACRPLLTKFLRVKKYRLDHYNLGESLSSINEGLTKWFWAWYYSLLRKGRKRAKKTC